MGHKKRRLLTLPAVGWLLVFTVLPLLIMLFYSVQADDGSGFTFANYLRFFSKGMYLKLTGRTIVWAVLVTVFSLLIAYPLAYILAKKLKGARGIILVLIIIPFFTNQLVRIYSWLIFLQDGGVLNRLLGALGLSSGDTLGILYTQAAVIIGLVHAYFPYMVITIYMALERMDDAMLEASASLGATKMTTFRRVVFPASMPGVVSGILIVFVPCLGTFVEPRILGGTDGMVIGTVIEDQFTELYGWNFGAAIAFLLLAMVLLSMMAISKWGRRYDV